MIVIPSLNTERGGTSCKAWKICGVIRRVCVVSVRDKGIVGGLLAAGANVSIASYVRAGWGC